MRTVPVTPCRGPLATVRVARIIAVVYGVLCAVSLALFAIGTFGWFGTEPGPLAAVFAILASMPWSLAFSALHSPEVVLAGMLAAMLLNIMLILAIGWAISKLATNHASGQR